MRRAAEFAVFLGLAAGLHLAIAAMGPRTEGAQSAGQRGDASVTLQAASAQVSEMVARWDTPPEVVDQASPQDMPEPELTAAEAAPAAPSLWEAAPVPRIQAPGLQLPQSYSPPDQLDTTPAQPSPKDPPEQVQVSDTRPKMRPEKPEKPTPTKPTTQKRAPVSQSSAAQTASGAGGGSNAGAAQNRGAATLSAGQRQSLFAQWGAQVRSKIERGKRYPPAARGASGTVQVRITIARDGTLRAVSVAASSGHPALDEAALRAVKSARRFPKAPRQLDEPTYTFTLAMLFST